MCSTNHLHTVQNLWSFVKMWTLNIGQNPNNPNLSSMANSTIIQGGIGGPGSPV